MKTQLVFLILFVSIIDLQTTALQRIVFGENFAYVIFGALTLIIIILKINSKTPTETLLYAVPFVLVWLVYLLLFELKSTNFYLSSVYYFIIPLIYSKNFIRNEDTEKLLFYASLSAIPIFIGLVFQVFLELDIFPMEIMEVDGVNEKRFTSILGSSLLMGIISSINSIVSLFFILYRKKFKICYLVLFFSATSLSYSYSRGAYMLTFIGSIILFVPKLRSINKNGWNLFTQFIIGCSLVIVVNNNDTLSSRVRSIFDFKNEGGNVERVLRWENALNSIYSNMLIGRGPGYSSSIGVSDNKELAWELGESGIITESFPLKVFVENGILCGFLYLAFLSKILYPTKKKFSLDNILYYSIVFGIIMESFILSSFESPYLSLIFWICIGKILTAKE